MLKSSVYGRVTKHLSLFFIFITTLSIVLLSQASSVSAVDSSATATVHVSEACSLTANVTEEHSDEMSNGTYTNSLGETKFTARCNDNAGFAIYAIGYSSDTYGITSMLGGDGLSIPTGTDALNGNTTSHWSMIIGKDTTSYQPANLTIENNFDSQHVIPSTYTKIASYSASTDGINGTGSSIFATYGVRISNTQPADTYVGKVKYTLVHPNMVDNSNKPVGPLKSTDCPAGYVCYAPNADDIEGSMASLGAVASSNRAGKISVGQSASATPTLIAPNYKRSGYGFAGWSTEYNYTTTSTSPIYGPNETITVDLSTSGLILYPVWVENAGNLQSWTGCSGLTAATYDSTSGTISATLSSLTALTDTRDGNVYTVARLADGQCWMVENLRLNNEDTTSTEDIALAQGYGNATTSINASGNNLGKFVGLADSEDANFESNTTANSRYSIDGSNDTININSNSNYYPGYRLPRYNKNNTNVGGKNASNTDLVISHNTSTNNVQWYSYGNYYNWPAAIANTEYYTTYSGTNGSDAAGTSICPTGWHLPLGYQSTGTLENGSSDTANRVGGFSYLDRKMGGTGQNQSSTAGSTQSVKWRAFPNNFIYSGYWDGSSAGFRGSDGYYWSSSAGNYYSAYNLYLGSSRVTPGTGSNSKGRGFSVRCVAGS